MDIVLCGGPSCGDRRPQRRRQIPRPGSRVCVACHESTRSAVEQLPDLFDECAAALAHTAGPPVGQIRRGSRRAGITLNDRAVAARSAILSTLASWAALIADERRVCRPERREPRALAAFVLTHLDWMLAHSAAVEFANEVVAVARVGRDSAPDAGRLEIGECVWPGCNAKIMASPREWDGRGGRDVKCAAGHVWRPHQWLDLAHQLRRRENPGDGLMGGTG
ncbi:hypothetical protein [Actinomadura litoris]|uniref:hypothetical protein n=1 Tax=Actinomadura litoris TaxID=2678616 RepID=UPI001FA7F9C9|nr:hypothetical protein [Actinomadura litoris]